MTDLDAGVSEGESVTQEAVFEVFRRSTEALRELLLGAVAGLPDERSCDCPHALDGTAAEGRWG